MSIDIKSQFIIDRVPQAPEWWYVDWSKLGPVEKDITKYKLCNIVFDNIKPWQIGLGKNVHLYRPKNPNMKMVSFRTTPPDPNDPIPEEVFQVEEYTEWVVHWISCEAWTSLQEYQYDMFINHLFRSRTPKEEFTGILFQTLDQANQFVDLMEAQFTFYVLKRTTADEW
jgi:hypothetical protein